MLISAREVAARLAPAGVTRRQTCELLAAGLAGPEQRTSASVLYDEVAAAALAARPLLTMEQVASACPWGVFVARAQPEVWRFAPTTSVWISTRIELHGPLPFVATMCGFVTRGAEITRTIPVRGGGYQLELQEPGGWFEQIRDRRLLTGRGRPWAVLGWPWET